MDSSGMMLYLTKMKMVKSTSTLKRCSKTRCGISYATNVLSLSFKFSFRSLEELLSTMELTFLDVLMVDTNGSTLQSGDHSSLLSISWLLSCNLSWLRRSSMVSLTIQVTLKKNTRKTTIREKTIMV